MYHGNLRSPDTCCALHDFRVEILIKIMLHKVRAYETVGFARVDNEKVRITSGITSHYVIYMQKRFVGRHIIITISGDVRTNEGSAKFVLVSRLKIGFFHLIPIAT